MALKVVKSFLGHNLSCEYGLIAENFVEILYFTELFRLAFPFNFTVFETWFHGLLQSLDDLTIQVGAAILNDTAGASACLSHPLTKVNITS